MGLRLKPRHRGEGRVWVVGRSPGRLWVMVIIIIDAMLFLNLVVDWF